MSTQQPTIALVHGAFPESASWNPSGSITTAPNWPPTPTEGLAADTPACKQIPSWFVNGGEDRIVPAELQRFDAERAGARGTREIADASHAISVSNPDAVCATILEAVAVTARKPAAAT
jgi:hypothetical protein